MGFFQKSDYFLEKMQKKELTKGDVFGNIEKRSSERTLKKQYSVKKKDKKTSLDYS